MARPSLLLKYTRFLVERPFLFDVSGFNVSRGWLVVCFPPGWWQYDERTSCELETAYKRSQRLCELLIAGFLYIIDFDQMLQYRKTEPTRRRRIKRDLASIPKKGVAGLRVNAGADDAAAAASEPSASAGSPGADLEVEWPLQKKTSSTSFILNFSRVSV